MGNPSWCNSADLIAKFIARGFVLSLFSYTALQAIIWSVASPSVFSALPMSRSTAIGGQLQAGLFVDEQFTHIGFAVLCACGDRPDKSLQNCAGHWFRKSGPKKIKVFRPSPIDRHEECMNFQADIFL